MEKEIDEALFREDQQNLEAYGFQLVTSKATKKAQKLNSSSIRSKYATRSKPSNYKLF